MGLAAKDENTCFMMKDPVLHNTSRLSRVEIRIMTGIYTSVGVSWPQLTCRYLCIMYHNSCGIWIRKAAYVMQLIHS